MTLKKCPSCGHQHDSADIICPYCKYSYSDKKFECKNCGAYLQPTDKVCYVCGKVAEVQKTQVPAPEIIEEKAVEDFKLKDDFSVDINNDTYNRMYDDSDDSQTEYNLQESKRPVKKKKSNKVLIACVIIVSIVALIAAGVCVCYYNGWIGEKAEEEEKTFTLYFDKPSSSQNLLDSQGTVYNWSGDVDVNYTSEGQKVKKSCKMTLEYDNIWYCEIPFDASNVYFSQSTLETVRTVALAEIVGENIYYVTDIVFNNSMQLPVAHCSLQDFDNFGINYTQETTQQQTTETEKETETSQTEVEQETQEETVSEQKQQNSDNYHISVPEQWQNDMMIVENGNCTNYYEKYNYNNYQCGKLLSVYVFEAGDNSYGEMNAEKIITADDGRKIVIVTPTDIQFDDSDETAIQKYTNLSQYINQVVESVQAK